MRWKFCISSRHILGDAVASRRLLDHTLSDKGVVENLWDELGHRLLLGPGPRDWVPLGSPFYSGEGGWSRELLLRMRAHFPTILSTFGGLEGRACC